MNKEILKKIGPIFKHLGIAVTTGVLIIVIFFYVYLPAITHHGETITIPDIVGMHIDELDEVLLDRTLRYEVNIDSGYNPDMPPLAVLEQFPSPLSKGKENRKVYVTLNAREPPLVKMPDLVNKSLKIAQITLKSYGLKLGKTEYRPVKEGLNFVLEQRWEGRQVLPGEQIPKGSAIDLYLADGRGNTAWKMYSYVDQPLEDAQIAIIGAGLKIGEIRYAEDPIGMVPVRNASGDTIRAVVSVSPGDVVKHLPAWRDSVRVQSKVDLWVYQPAMDSLRDEDNLLDNEMP